MPLRLPLRTYLPAWMGLASGGLLALCFHPFSHANLSWVALVPLLIGLRFLDRRYVLATGFFTGWLYWLATLVWLTRVTVPGYVLLAAYCALYTLPFVVTVHRWMARFGTRRLLANLGLMVVATAVWTGAEWMRSVLLTGFPWNPLGAAHHANLALLTHTTWGGSYAVTALVVWVNTGLALTLLRYIRPEDRTLRRPHLELTAAISVLLLAYVTGLRTLQDARAAAEGTDLRAVLVQPNIPQDEKWTEEKIDFIYHRLYELTEPAMSFTQPDLVIWPETALPEDLRFSERAYGLVRDLTTGGSPLLVGTMDTVWSDLGEAIYFNSAMLFGTNGQWVAQYDKRHLVLMGEYVPWGDDVPILRVMSPISASFTPGATSTVFRLDQPAVAFSVLICFEDTMAYLGREAVRNGARLLINQTNDAWFDPLEGSHQHLVHSVLRAAENRVPVLRAANTGITCAIDRFGRVYDRLEGDEGQVRIHGFQVTSVSVPPEDHPLTWYTRHGDVFAWACFGIGLPALLAAAVDHRRSRFQP